MVRGPLRRVHIGSGEYSSTRRTPRPILALVTSISKRVLAATSTRFPRVILASIEYTRYSFYTLHSSSFFPATQKLWVGWDVYVSYSARARVPPLYTIYKIATSTVKIGHLELSSRAQVRGSVDNKSSYSCHYESKSA